MTAFVRVFLGIPFLAGCLQQEPLNVEAAIDGCSGPQIQMSTIRSDTKTIELFLTSTANPGELELNFQLPDGARIESLDVSSDDHPPVYDFSQSSQRRFRVISESGTVEAVYQLRVRKRNLPLLYDFEALQSEQPYAVFYLADASTNLTWASGNAGFQFSGMAKQPADYPTTQADGGVGGGRYARLVTRSTGLFGAMVRMPIAVGNLFIGAFDDRNAVIAPLKATRFGYPFTERPVALSGWYRYKAGEVMKDRDGKTLKDVRDRGDIYAVFYESPTPDYTLNGAWSDQSGEQWQQVIAIARVPHVEDTETWKAFRIPFVMQEGKTIQPDALLKGRYKLAVVCTSSIGGGYFEGAVGSELGIDKLEVICE